MTKDEVIKQLVAWSDPQTKKTYMRHGAQEPFYGVKIANLKIIQKKVKKDYQLSKDLFETGISDAQYLAGLLADETKMTKKDLAGWVKKANWHMIGECSVAWVAAESKHGWELGLEWIDSKKDSIAAAGWSTLTSVVSLLPDASLDMKQLAKLLLRVEKEIHKAGNRTRSSMNGFIIGVGSFVAPMTEQAKAAAKKIGAVMVDVGDTACKVPDAIMYIDKVKKAGKLGKKKKEARC